MANIPISDRTAREFGRFVSHLMQLKGPDYTRRELAAAIGVSPQLVSLIVNKGHIPAPDVLARLADELGVSRLEMWLAAYHELLPPGYAITPISKPDDPAAETVASYMARNPAFARLYHAYERAAPEEREATVAVLERLFRGSKTGTDG